MNSLKRQYEFAVCIGRFEPFHNAHRRVIERALSVADKVLVLIGSTNKPRSTKDPFYADERRVMIGASLPHTVVISRREMLMLGGRCGSLSASKKRASSISTPSGRISPPA